MLHRLVAYLPGKLFSIASLDTPIHMLHTFTCTYIVSIELLWKWTFYIVFVYEKQSEPLYFTPEIIRPMLDMLDFTLATCLPRVNRQRLTLTLTLVCEQWKEGEAFTPILQGNSIY